MNGIVYSQENYPQHTPQAPRFNYTPPGERLFADPPNSPCTHPVPTSQTIPYSHPEPATSPCGDSSNHLPWCIPKAVDLWVDVQPQGEDNYWGESSLPLEASRPLDRPLFTSPYHSPSRRTGDELPGVMSRGQRYPTSDTRTDSNVTGSRPLEFLLRIKRSAAAPPLVSLPPSKPYGNSNWYRSIQFDCYFRRTNASISGQTSLSSVIVTNRSACLIGIPKRVSMQPFGRLRDGRQKTDFKVSGKRGTGSHRISKVKEEQDCMVQTRAERHLGSRAPLGGVRPGLGIHHTCASRSLHSS